MSTQSPRLRLETERAMRRTVLTRGLALAACGAWRPVHARAVAELRSFREAVGVLAAHARFPVGTITPGADPERTLKRLIAEHDPYGDYLTATEFQRYRAASREDYAGIGAAIEHDAHGDLRIFPDPDGPAARAGVPAGARLVAIAGQALQELPLPSIAALAVGPRGSVLELELVGSDSIPLRVNVPRERISGPSVRAYRLENRQVLGIRAFTPDSRRELEALLVSAPGDELAILDLRGCFGGDLHAAIDCAMLFLDRGQLIAVLRRPSGAHAWRCTRADPPLHMPLVLWQDGATASAAEVFIAALHDHRRALTVGRPSFGKGSVQEVFSLVSGGALILTTAEVRSPAGRLIDHHSYIPERVVGEGVTTASAWLALSSPAGTPAP